MNVNGYEICPGANLSGANLSGANLSGANLSSADLRGANLRGANLSCANLRGANLSGANLRGANLSSADLSSANLSCANLRGANLSGANLSGANLRGANLSSANLSGAKDMPTARAFLSGFERDAKGVIVYKCFQGSYSAPARWKIEPGAIIREVVNPDRATDCGSGVNVATLAWVREAYPGKAVWRCRIAWRDLADAVVPFGTNGKFRCARLRLLQIVGDEP